MAFDDEFGYHEALDRTHVLVSMLDDHILTHPVISGDPEMSAQAEKAEKELGELYQLISKKSDQKFHR